MVFYFIFIYNKSKNNNLNLISHLIDLIDETIQYDYKPKKKSKFIIQLISRDLKRTNSF